ncbi:hypothetical protein Vadar_012302 [Vaccinium darrowii]|uniref:Uncharacterized protein n=1 Tax=Vaccinium darrowii TaxID=229202 RepID=A0ACB7YV98_9ERIC|nr:hypothetical protein Vadar_012302 [Vaccinium darrowii]
MSDLHPPSGQINGVVAPPLTAAPQENVGTKRQRRPSVRLGDIGDPAYDSQPNRKPKQQQQHQWRLPTSKDPNKGSRTRPVTTFAPDETLGGGREGNLENPVSIGSWRVKDSKSKRGFNKRVRSNWGGSGEEREDVDEEGFREFGIESPMKDRSPIETDSLGNDLGDEYDDGDENRGNFEGNRKGDFARVSDGVELEGPSDSGARNWNNNNSGERNGVRVWLNQLGLGRYAPVFEIHEVDDEVLPLLTLEDLKDMGINAVGSRRKMYCAIQKLSKGFS